MSEECPIEKRLKELNVTLPGKREVLASYTPAVRVGHLLYLSGQDCSVNGEFLHKGKLGKEFTVEEGQQFARQCMINALQVIKDYGGGLNNVKRIIKMLAWVSSAKDFNDQPFVINGASDFLEEVFGESGKHARSAVGTNELPLNIPVEIELIVELKE
ncbi:RidA family protein [Pseudogracilibacillus auburnensis]|uniref:Enamine deaminase RidA (YjgF/YER057c/UK114 family) n=1 Tax=Pseudogracilibacillus auburnensis TaxID=1494959 RepID=A0A2V3VZD9_9BACI|nr:RidA family protein [Pseudogracilibacillus auburnensis]MBO1002319.1 RidA family protein [Pseudogracilibacillus auburnensis]PXW86294.1 enamine deaminase RidA (YjgF/YER057c/UK114 family) [Pseudogracilibacillus auburnensis]